jgi:hypothetical protein
MQPCHEDVFFSVGEITPLARKRRRCSALFPVATKRKVGFIRNDARLLLTA